MGFKIIATSLGPKSPNSNVILLLPLPLSPPPQKNSNTNINKLQKVNWLTFFLHIKQLWASI